MTLKFKLFSKLAFAVLLSLLGCIWQELYAQESQSSTVEISGVIIDETGESLPRASVVINHGVQAWKALTGLDGKFQIRIPSTSLDAKSTISISFIGYEKKVVKMSKGKTNYHIVMNDLSQQIEEVVVTGYRTMDRRKVSSSITSLKMDDILMPGMTSIEQSLEGRVPDLMYMSNSGEAGATARLRIRGTSTLIGNREPLWVLDGIVLQEPVNVTTDQLNDPDYINYIGNAISGLNPQDIERIDILKDASATALYGTRAGNGVIVISTKKGKSGAPRISYNAQFKYVVRPRYSDSNINLMNSQERVQFGKDLTDLHYAFPANMTMIGYEGAYNNYITGKTNFDEFTNEVQKYEYANTDWFKLLTNDALTHSHTVSLSGGTDTFSYYASIGYNRENGTVKSVYSDRYTTSLNMQADITSKLKANIRLNASVQKNNHLPNAIDALGYAYNTTRALPAFNEDGSLYYYKKHAYSIGNGQKNDQYKYNYNILNEINNSSNEYDANSILAALNLQYKFNDFLDASAEFAYQRSSSNTGTWFGERSNYVAQLKNGEVNDTPIQGESGLCDLPYGGVYNTSNNVSETMTGRFQMNLHKFLDKGRKHLISGVLGYEVNSATVEGLSDETRGYYKDRGKKYISMEATDLQNYPLYASWLANGHRTVTSSKLNTLSGYISASYSYKNLFSLNSNARFDASNKFGQHSNNKFLPVWSVSGMLNLKELALSKWNPLDDLRLRTSYGKTGNMVDGQSPNLLIKMGTVDSYYSENISSVSAFPNPNLRWEQVNSFNLGMDISFFNSRVMATAEFYTKITKDAFAQIAVPLTNGVSSYTMNNGDVKNMGYSITLSGYPIRKKDLNWYLSTTYSYVKNQVQSNTNKSYTLDDYLNGTAIIDGQPVSTFYSYGFKGLDPKNGMPLFDDYADRRHLLKDKALGEIVQMVMLNSGQRDPKFAGSLYSSVSWKQFSLNTNFTYSLGNKIRLFNLYSDILSGVSSENNVRKEFLNRWKVPGDELRTVYPALMSPSDSSYSTYRYHWSAGGQSIAGVPSFAENAWTMYDKSDLRVVSGDYLRLSQLTLRYQFTPRQLKNWPIKTLRLDFTTSNVFTICSSKLKGQDPSQSGFSSSTTLSIRPSYTFGINVSF